MLNFASEEAIIQLFKRFATFDELQHQWNDRTAGGGRVRAERNR